MNEQLYWKEQMSTRGIRTTKQRMAILHVLIEQRRPLSAQDIFFRLQENNPRLRLSTVYRNLNLFTEKEMVRKIDFRLDKRECCFELVSGEHHHHLICIDCGEIIPLDCPLRDYQRKISQETEYTILDHTMKIYGLCPQCK